MKHRCFNCDYLLSHLERMKLTPKAFQFSPPCFICPDWREKIGSTELSRFSCRFTLLFSLFGSVIALLSFSPSDSIILIVMTILVLLNLKVNQYIVWPFIINLKKWETLQESLPKSRFVGYSLFLVLPILIFIGLFWLGIN